MSCPLTQCECEDHGATVKATVARLQAANERLFRKHRPTGVLTSEEDENGMVHVRHEDGSLYAMMPRVVWDELMASLDRSADR